jgi:hypothetical protein
MNVSQTAFGIASRCALVSSLLFAHWSSAANARDDGQWGGSAPYLRQWFESLTQPDNPMVSCCGEADAVIADIWNTNSDGSINATVTEGRSILLEGSTVLIPRNKIVHRSNNPTGHSIIFYSHTQGVYCFVLGPMH